MMSLSQICPIVAYLPIVDFWTRYLGILIGHLLRYTIEARVMIVA